jgi:hypothetical protein
MPKVELSIADSSPCLSCEADIPFEDEKCPSCGSEFNIRVGFVDIYDYLIQGCLLDARDGGLIVGRDHDEDDIPMLIMRATGIFQLIGYMQGGEYILNYDVSKKHREEIEEINAYKSSDYSPLTSIELTNTTRVLNTNGNCQNIVLLVNSGQFVINRAATAKYYYQLERLNRSTS